MRTFASILVVAIALCSASSWADDFHHHSGHSGPACPSGNQPPAHPPYSMPHAVPAPPGPPPEWLGPEGYAFFPFWYCNWPYSYRDEVYPQQEQKPQYYQGVRTAGELRVRVIPAEATLLVDGQMVTDKDSSQAYTIGLLTGTHTLEVTAHGYHGKMQDVEIQQARTTSITVELTPR